MIHISMEVARACLVIGLVFTALIYARTRVASGGAVTGSYIAFLLLTSQWLHVIGWFALALMGVAAIRLVSKRWPLSRTWMYYIAIAVPATVHVLLIYAGDSTAFGGLSAVLIAGLYVTNGLTAYDMQRQGIYRTLLSITIVVALTLVVIIPLNWAMQEYAAPTELTGYFTPVEPALILLCIYAAAAVHLGLGWGTAGIIGGLFLIELVSWQSILLLIAMTWLGAQIARPLSRLFGLSPRQRLYTVLIVGSIVSWFGLFWLDWFGFQAAKFQDYFGIETLLVIGLLISEIVRVGALRTYGGAAIVMLITGLVSWGSTQQFAVFLATVVGAVALIIALLWVGIQSQRGLWRRAIKAGDRWAVLNLADARAYTGGEPFVTVTGPLTARMREAVGRVFSSSRSSG